MSEAAVAGVLTDTAISEVQRLADELEVMRADRDEMYAEVQGQRARIADLVAQLDEMKRQETRGVRIGGTYLMRDEVVELRWAVKAAVERTKKAEKVVEKEEIEDSLHPLQERLERLNEIHKLLNPGIPEGNASEPQARRRVSREERGDAAVDAAMGEEKVDPADPIDVLVTLLNKRDLGAAFTPEIVGAWTEEERRQVGEWLHEVAEWERASSIPEATDEERAEIARVNGEQAPLAVKRVLYDAETTHRLLLLIEDPEQSPTREEVAGWSDEDRVAVAEYATAVHVQASDNDDYPVPLMPQVLVDRAVGEGPFFVGHVDRHFIAPLVPEEEGKPWVVSGPKETVAGFFAHPWQAIDRARRLNARAAEFDPEGMTPADLARAVAADYEDEGQRRWEATLTIGMEHLDPYLMALRMALVPTEIVSGAWEGLFKAGGSDAAIVEYAESVFDPPGDIHLADGAVVRSEYLPGSGALLVTVALTPGDWKKWAGGALVEPIRQALADLIPSDPREDWPPQEDGVPTDEEILAMPSLEDVEEWDREEVEAEAFEGIPAAELAPIINARQRGEEQPEDGPYGDVSEAPFHAPGTFATDNEVPDAETVPPAQEPAEPRYVVVGARKPCRIVDTTTGQVVPGCDDLSKGEAVAKAAAWNRTPELAPAAEPTPPAETYPAELLARLSEEERKIVIGGEYRAERAPIGGVWHVANNAHVRATKQDATEALETAARFNSAREALLNGKQPETPALPAEHPAMGGQSPDEAEESGYDGPMRAEMEAADEDETSPVDELLHHALYRKDEAPERWSATASGGCSDQALSLAISAEFGTDERFDLTGIGKARVRGGIHPQFIALVVGQEKAVTIMGQALVQHVRELLKIPQPQQAQEPQVQKAPDFDDFCDECFNRLNAAGVCESCGWVKG